MAPRLGAAPKLASSGPILALHGTCDVVSAALLREGRVVGRLLLDGGRAGIQLPALADRLLGDAGLRPADLGKIAVAVGPGSFTGIKVTLAAAYGISRAAGVGVAGIGSLEILSEQTPDDAPALAVIPAGRGDFFIARYGPRVGARRPAQQAPELAAAPRLRELAPGAVLVHLGCGPLPDLPETVGSCEADPARLADDLARLAIDEPSLEPGQMPDPVYLRRTWAEEALEKRQGGERMP